MPNAIVTGFFSAAGTPLELWQRNPAVTSHPSACEYIHLDLSTESLGLTSRYNCWGFTFLPRRYWLSRSAVDALLQDNCVPVPNGSVEVGDVIRYRAYNPVGVLETTHTGRVWQTDGVGHATWIRSKWGPNYERIHEPLCPDLPESYGTDLAYFRQHSPLRGDSAQANKIADLWIKDSPSDNGQQGIRAPWWTSPDILVDVPPYDGAPDLNPVFDHPNRIWAVVRNRTDQRVDNVLVRFYWADPAAGLPASAWNLVPAAPGHPNPVGPISIDGYASVQTDYVEWVPTTAPAHQCLLAIAYVNDNPRDSGNPDPIVYPFDVPFDNNIGQRNVEVMTLKNGSSGEFSIRIANPFHTPNEVTGFITAVLTFSPRLPVIGFPRQIRPLQVLLSLDKAEAVSLRTGERHQSLAGRLIPGDPWRRERIVASLTLPQLKLPPKKAHRLDVRITAPRNAVKGAAYYLHIIQTVSGMVTGGYTAVVVVG